jgi:hypothetical protein
MRISVLSIFKPIALSIAAIAIMGLGQGVANADEVFIAGYTNGCFNNNNMSGGCLAGDPPNTSSTQTASLFGLQYVNSTFSGMTVGGTRTFFGSPAAPPTQNVNNLGAFSLANSLATYTGSTFELRVTFTAPEGIAGSGSTVIEAMLTGMVSSNGTGGVFIDFDHNEDDPILFTFSNANGSGSFFFSVNDLAINSVPGQPSQVAAITGQITGAQQQQLPIAEPASLLLIGTGLAGVAAVLRRKLRSS